jgi:hypothetical protein
MRRIDIVYPLVIHEGSPTIHISSRTGVSRLKWDCDEITSVRSHMKEVII